MNFLLIISIIINLFGYLNDFPIYITAAQILMCASFVVDHYKKYKLDKINPIIIFASTMAITSFGHFLAFYNLDEKDNLYFQYFKYSIPQYYGEAMEIFYVGVLCVILGYNMGTRTSNFLPSIKVNVNSYSAFKTIFYLSVFLLLVQNAIKLPGSLQKIIILIPIVSLFILNIIGHKYNVKLFKNYSAILTVLCIFINFLNSYLRFNIISPLILYIISLVIINKDVKFLFSFKSVPVILGIILFTLSFSRIGKMRTKYYSTMEQKIEYIINGDQEDQEEIEDESKKQTILSRATVINQLTQVVRVKEEDGLYYGKTLLYLGYVFIPRFVWPDKPIVQQGGWFAERIGLAYRNSAGQLNNSINMTIYGEAYMNFDYYGVVLISLFFGMLIAKLWQSSGGLSNYFNLVGVGYALFLISYATFQMGADLQIIVTFISVYLIFLFISYLFNEFTK